MGGCTLDWGLTLKYIRRSEIVMNPLLSVSRARNLFMYMLMSSFVRLMGTSFWPFKFRPISTQRNLIAWSNSSYKMVKLCLLYNPNFCHKTFQTPQTRPSKLLIQDVQNSSYKKFQTPPTRRSKLLLPDASNSSYKTLQTPPTRRSKINYVYTAFLCTDLYTKLV